MVTTKLMTADDLLAMGSDAPYELIDGELIEVSPTSFESSHITAQLTMLIAQFVVSRKLGWMTSAEGGMVLRRNPDTVVAPDIGFISKERFPAGQNPHKFLSVAPDLAVEVVSPSNSTAGLARKLAVYQAAGVPLVWIVYPDQRSVTIHVIGEPAQTFFAGNVLDGGTVLRGLLIPVDDIFASPLDD